MSRPLRPAAFAIPGDHRRRTGGFIYERRLLEELRGAGRNVAHLVLPASFPNPAPADTATTAVALGRVPAERPLILDGLVFGAIDTAVLAGLACPIVAMLHHPLGLETGLAPDRAAFLLAREAANLRLAAHVVVPSAHTARVLAGLLGADPRRITVAPPGYDGPRDVVRADAEPLILSVGLLARRKGHDVLVRALAGVADLDWRAAIVGKSYDLAVERELRAMVADLGLGTRVEIAGEVEDDDLAARYRAARLFVLATRYEGYGMALAEALGHGLPVVTCRVGAVPDTVGDAALLVEPDDPAALAGAIRRVLVEPGIRTALGVRAAAAGAALPHWPDTAAIVGCVLDGL